MIANHFAEPSSRAEWELSGTSKMTHKQQKMLNACCGDLAQQIQWHGNRLSKDDYRHLFSGMALGWRMMPAYDRGEGAAGFVMLGGSSLNMSKTQAADAITMALHVGDHPEEQNLKCKPVRWCDAVLRGLGFSAAEMAA